MEQTLTARQDQMASESTTSGKLAIKYFDKVSETINRECERLGARFDGPSKNASYRGYTKDRGYIAITRADQETSGAYSGLSFVIFPILESEETYTCVVTICTGTDDLGEDEELSTLPWFRRSYTDLSDAKKPRDEENTNDAEEQGAENSQGKFFIKTSFSDAVSELTPMIETLAEMEGNDKADLTVIKKYYKYITAAIIVDITASDVVEDSLKKYIDDGKDCVSHGMRVLLAWLAQYAKIRGWEAGKRGVYERQDKLISRIKANSRRSEAFLMKEVCELLYDAKYIVVQGAPGTGKTRMANKIASEGISDSVKFAKTYFTQFHAETTYSDFVGGIRPVLSKGEKGQFQFEYKEGILTEVIKEASKEENKDKNYLLIIDEINRANLKNVLGPVFYLFERPVDSADEKRAKMKIETAEGGSIELSALPSNIYVIATMNTSDRSLAMVDFALRRRFSWYTLYPYDLSATRTKDFHSELFNKVSELFDKYATDEELPLQPGHSYFIAKDVKEMEFRLTYEIMPLMKEYFAAGLMLKARDEFAAIYYDYTGKFMYR